MKQKNDQISNLFSRLDHAEMPLKNDLWKDIEKDLPVTKHKVVSYRWISIAAAFVGVVGIAAALWFNAPSGNKDKRMAQSVSQPVKNKMNVYSLSSSPSTYSQSKKDLVAYNKTLSDVNKTNSTRRHIKTIGGDENKDSLVHVTVTIRQYEYGHISQVPSNTTPRQNVSYGNDNSTAQNNSQSNDEKEVFAANNIPVADNKLAFTASVGTNRDENVVYGVGIEKKVANKLSVVSGVTYANAGEADNGEHQQFIGVPLELKYDLCSSDKFNLYTKGGIKVEQCIRNGSSTNVGVLASLGAQYKFNDKLALYVEPELKYNIDDKASVDKFHTVSGGVTCGVRFIY